jgi:hypothetical protein
MLKALNKLRVTSQKRVATWCRWYRKLPHNRVRRPSLRDDRGRRIGYWPPLPIPEPEIPPGFCQRVELPSGRIEIMLSDHGVEAAYRQARYPKASPAEVAPLSMCEDEIRRLHNELCRA